MLRPKRTPKQPARMLEMQQDVKKLKPPKQRKMKGVNPTTSNDCAINASLIPSTSTISSSTPGVSTQTTWSPRIVACESKGNRCTKQELRAEKFLKNKKEIHLVIDCSKIDEEDINIDEMCNFIRETTKVANVVERQERMVHFTSRELIKKSYLKYILKKFLRTQRLGANVHVVGDGLEKYQLEYYTR